jgi:hypothetical protein
MLFEMNGKWAELKSDPFLIQEFHKDRWLFQHSSLCKLLRINKWKELCQLKNLPHWAWWHIPVILAIWRVEIGRIVVQDQLGKKFPRPHLNQWLGVVA